MSDLEAFVARVKALSLAMQLRLAADFIDERRLDVALPIIDHVRTSPEMLRAKAEQIDRRMAN